MPVARVVLTQQQLRLRVAPGAVEQLVVVAVAQAVPLRTRRRLPDALAALQQASREQHRKVAAMAASRRDVAAGSRASGIAAFQSPRAQ